MVILAIVGLFALAHGGLPSRAQALICFVVLIAVIVAVAAGAPRRRSVWEHDVIETDYPIERNVTAPNRVLDYGRPVESHTALKVAGGFFLFICGAIVGLFSV